MTFSAIEPAGGAYQPAHSASATTARFYSARAGEPLHLRHLDAAQPRLREFGFVLSSFATPLMVPIDSCKWGQPPRDEGTGTESSEDPDRATTSYSTVAPRSEPIPPGARRIDGQLRQEESMHRSRLTPAVFPRGLSDIGTLWTLQRLGCIARLCGDCTERGVGSACPHFHDQIRRPSARRAGMALSRSRSSGGADGWT